MAACQGSSLAFVASRTGSGKTEQGIVAVSSRGDALADAIADTFADGDFDPETGTVSTSAEGRGLADCGMSASWIWDGADWPTLFVSRQ